MVFLLGSAIDFQRVASAKTRIQQAVDSAVIAVAKASATQSDLSSSQAQALAQNVIDASLGSSATAMKLSVTESKPATNTYMVGANGSMPTTIMQIAGVKSVAISASATAQVKLDSSGGGGGGGCVLSLNDSAVDAFWDTGNVTVSLVDCDLYVNSTNGGALDVSGNAELSARKISVVGGVSGMKQITTTQGVFTSQSKIADPYFSVPTPAYSGCTKTNYSSKTTETLDPGVYCGGLQLNAKADVTLSPGLYVFDKGDLTVNGQATLKGSDVTLVFTSSTGSDWATATINGGATVDLKAPTTSTETGGSIAGVLFYGDRAMSMGTNFKLNGGSTQSLVGAVYLPEAALNIAGTSTTTPGHGCIEIIADTIKFTGNSTTAVDGCVPGFGMKTFGPPTSAGNTIVSLSK